MCVRVGGGDDDEAVAAAIVVAILSIGFLYPVEYNSRLSWMKPVSNAHVFGLHTQSNNTRTTYDTDGKK